MEKNKYLIKKKVDNNQQLYILVKDEKVIFTTDNYNLAFSIINGSEGLFSDEQIFRNIERAHLQKKEMLLNEVEQKYEQPVTAIDMLIALFMIFSVVGFLIIAGQLSFSDGSLVTGIVVLLAQLILMGTILTSRKIDRALLDRLDEVEKKLDMYKKIKDDKQ